MENSLKERGFHSNLKYESYCETHGESEEEDSETECSACEDQELECDWSTWDLRDLEDLPVDPEEEDPDSWESCLPLTAELLECDWSASALRDLEYWPFAEKEVSWANCFPLTAKFLKNQHTDKY